MKRFAENILDPMLAGTPALPGEPWGSTGAAGPAPRFDGPRLVGLRGARTGAKGEALFRFSKRAAVPATVSLAVLGAAALSAAWAGTATATTITVGPRATTTINCGGGNAAPAINKAIQAASKAGGGTLVFPKGTCHVNGTVHVMSHITFQLNDGAVLVGAGSGYDKPESNPNDKFQDFAHSHFHDAMFF